MNTSQLGSLEESVGNTTHEFFVVVNLERSTMRRAPQSLEGNDASGIRRGEVLLGEERR